MSGAPDAELARELDALVAAKERAQRQSRIWFAAAVGMIVMAFLAHHHPLITLGWIALAVTAVWVGTRAHLRADALRGQAMEKILAEAFRRAGEESTP
jgi:hypothetical protein